MSACRRRTCWARVGRGHVIALNVLNCGRLEMGPIAVRGDETVLRRLARLRTSAPAFGRPLAELGAIQEKLADMAVRLFAAESAAWRAMAWSTPSDRRGRDLTARAGRSGRARCARGRMRHRQSSRVGDARPRRRRGRADSRRLRLPSRLPRRARVSRRARESHLTRAPTKSTGLRSSVCCFGARERRAVGAVRGDGDRRAKGSRAKGRGARPTLRGTVAAWARQLTLAALHLAHERYGESLMDEQEVVHAPGRSRHRDVRAAGDRRAGADARQARRMALRASAGASVRARRRGAKLEHARARDRASRADAAPRCDRGSNAPIARTLCSSHRSIGRDRPSGANVAGRSALSSDIDTTPAYRPARTRSADTPDTNKSAACDCRL